LVQTENACACIFYKKRTNIISMPLWLQACMY